MTKYKIGQMFRLKDRNILSIEQIKGDKYVCLLTSENSQGLAVISEPQLDEHILSEFIWEKKDEEK